MATVHAPQPPSPHPIFVPVSRGFPRRSQCASVVVTGGISAAVSEKACPLMVTANTGVKSMSPCLIAALNSHSTVACHAQDKTTKSRPRPCSRREHESAHEAFDTRHSTRRRTQVTSRMSGKWTSYRSTIDERLQFALVVDHRNASAIFALRRITRHINGAKQIVETLRRRRHRCCHRISAGSVCCIKYQHHWVDLGHPDTR